jgi:hypothetical protein
LIAHSPVFVFSGLSALVFAKDPGAGLPRHLGAAVAVSTVEVPRCLLESGYQG